MDPTSSASDQPTASYRTNVTGTRIIAALIDIAILAALFLVMAATMGEFGTDEDGMFQVYLTGFPFVLYMLITLAYYLAAEALLFATPGKLAMGLTVIKLNGEPLGFGAALVRNLLRFVDSLPFFYIVGLISIAVSSNNQRIGDLAAGTVVVKLLPAQSDQPLNV